MWLWQARCHQLLVAHRWKQNNNNNVQLCDQLQQLFQTFPSQKMKHTTPQTKIVQKIHGHVSNLIKLSLAIDVFLSIWITFAQILSMLFFAKKMMTHSRALTQ